MKLFHFTHLLSLPGILREGIIMGEVPISPDIPYDDRPKAANLTTNENQSEQSWYSSKSKKKQSEINLKYGPPLTNKMAIRLTIAISEGELTSFQEAAKRFNTSPEWEKKLGSAQERQQWFYAFEGVRPDQIRKIERLVKGKYCKLSPDELNQLVTAIEKEREQKLIVEGEQMTIYFKPGYSESWLIDGPKWPDPMDTD